jgi:hypothetical protein
MKEASEHSGLVKVLPLCIGAPVMLMTNLSTPLGLTIGTCGRVYDVVFISECISVAAFPLEPVKPWWLPTVANAL